MSVKRMITICGMLFMMSFFSACGNESISVTESTPTDVRAVVHDEEITIDDTEEVVDVLQDEMVAPVPTEEVMQTVDELEPMEVHFIDVGEADSALIICGDEAMLVDTGNPDQGSMIRLYLKQHNVNGLKYLLLTHSDRDHIGGAASVISNIEIENLFMCRYEKDNDVYANMMNEINYKNMSWSTPDVGAEYQLGDAIITIIAPNRDYDNPNDSSIAFVIRHGENSFIFTGDAEETAEADIVNNGLDISADVYYVGHHGSHTSSTQPFLDKVNPKYAVISCAKDNEYGHPHIETMEKLKAMGVSLFRTDDQGSIICYSDNNGISFNAEPSDNWANGNAEINESMSTQVVNAMMEATNAVEEEQISEELEITYVLNTNSMKFHKPSCDSVNDMKEKNRQDVSLSRDEVLELGYQGCKRCNP